MIDAYTGPNRSTAARKSTGTRITIQTYFQNSVKLQTCRSNECSQHTKNSNLPDYPYSDRDSSTCSAWSTCTLRKGTFPSSGFATRVLPGQQLILQKKVWLAHTWTFTDTDVTLPYLVEGATVMEQPHATTVPPFPFCGSKSIETSFSVCRSVRYYTEVNTLTGATTCSTWIRVTPRFRSV